MPDRCGWSRHTAHVGHAARVAERFRYEGDPTEVQLKISKEAAASILRAAEFAPAAVPLEQVCAVLKSMGFTGFKRP